jgi:Protein of unknown function (DUF2635)
MFVIPKAGFRVRDPVKKDYLPNAGREVGEATAYWRRRVSDGDVTQGEAPPPESRRVSALKKGSE